MQVFCVRRFFSLAYRIRYETCRTLRIHYCNITQSSVNSRGILHNFMGCEPISLMMYLYNNQSGKNMNCWIRKIHLNNFLFKWYFLLLKKKKSPSRLKKTSLINIWIWKPLKRVNYHLCRCQRWIKYETPYWCSTHQKWRENSNHYVIFIWRNYFLDYEQDLFKLNLTPSVCTNIKQFTCPFKIWYMYALSNWCNFGLTL